MEDSEEIQTLATGAAIRAVTGRDVSGSVKKALSTLSAARSVAMAQPARNELLDSLKESKRESDRKNYGRKTAIMRLLLQKYPDAFKVDSQGKFVGLTHLPTKFRIHLRSTALPTSFLQQQPKDKELKSTMSVPRLLGRMSAEAGL